MSHKISLVFLAIVVLASSASGGLVDFRERYQDYLGNWHTYTSENLNSYPFYAVTDNGNNYTVSRLDDSITLPKANTTYTFAPEKISFTLNLTPAKLNSRSVLDGANWYIPIPKPLTSLRFGWDDRKPTVTNNTGYVIPEDNFWYDKVNGQVRFYYNQTARTIGAGSSYLTFEFNSYTINNATTSGWTTANVSLNGSRVTGNGLLANHLNASYLNGLVAYYSFDEPTGVTIHNVNTESGGINTTNQCTWNGNTTLNYTTGKIGNAGLLDGVNDYYNCGNDESLNITGAITVSAFVNASSWNNEAYNSIVMKAGTVGDPGYTGYELTQDWGWIKFKFYDNWAVVGQATVSNTQASINNPHLITGVYNGANLSIYIDGVLKNTASSPALNTTFQNLLIGGSGAVSMFNGSISEVAIWIRALSAAEIAEWYNRSMRILAMPVILNQTASAGKVINRVRINHTGQDATKNASIYSRQNGTTSWTLIQTNATSGTWYDIPSANQFNNMDFAPEMNSNGSDTVFLESLEWDEGSSNFVNFTFSNISISENQIYQSSQATVISVDINDSDGYISSVTAGITYLGVEFNYSMAGGNDTWTYSFKSGVPGTYTLTHIYATDNSSGTNSTTSSLQFVVVPVTSQGSSSASIASTPVSSQASQPTILKEAPVKSMADNINILASNLANLSDEVRWSLYILVFLVLVFFNKR